MGIGTTGSVTGIIGAALFSAKNWLNPSSAPEFYSHIEITPKGGLFADWKLDKDGNELNECMFWNATHYYAPRICDAFGVSRISTSSGIKAVDRAIKCGAEFDAQCILSGEIGFSSPAAFLYDSEHGFRMILAPRIMPPEEQCSTKLVRLQDPSEQAHNTLMKFNSTVVVEYINPGSRAVVTESMAGADAYCIQTLRASVSPACWTELD